jgi:capsular exopolysaccharide synthesis family protein
MNGRALLSGPSQSKAAPNAVELLKAVGRRWKPALLVGLFCAAIAGAAGYLLSPPPKHTARTLLHLQEKQPVYFFNTSPDGRNNYDSYQRMQSAMVRSRLVLNAALNEPDVAKLASVQQQVEPVAWLEREIRVDFAVGPEIMRISMSGDQEDDLRKIVTAVRESYLNNVANKDQRDRRTKLDNLKKLSGKYEGKLTEKKEQLRSLAKAVGAGDKEVLVLKQQIALTQLSMAKNELAELRSEVRRQKVELEGQLRDNRNAWPELTAPLIGFGQPGLPINLAAAGLLHGDETGSLMHKAAVAKMLSNHPQVLEAIEKHPKVKSRLDAIAGKEAQLALHEKTNPKASLPKNLQEVKTQLKKDREDLAAEREKVRPEIYQNVLDQMGKESGFASDKARAKLANLKKLETLLEKDVETLAQDSRDLHDKTVDMGPIKEEIERLDSLVKKMDSTITTLEVEVDAPERVVKMEDTVVLFESNHSKQILIGGFSGVVALAMVMLLFGFVEFRQRRINSPEELTSKVGIRVMGTLPDYAYRHRSRLLGQGFLPEERWQNMFNAAVDSTRTTLLLASKCYGVRVVLVTSAVAGEGKTSLACHLAASLDRAGYKTLLLDGDLRMPTAHRLFGLPRSPGFSELLRGEMDVDNVIQKTPIGELDLLAAGQGDAVATQSLAKKPLADILTELRRKYDFIIIDSCPVLPVADSLLIGQYADAVLFSVLRDVSRVPKVQEAYQRVGLLGLPILGAVVNGARDDVYGGSYRYAYEVSAGD